MKMRTVARLLAIFMAAFLLASPAFSKDVKVKYKTVEAKHFDRAEGVETSPEFSDYLYAELRAQLQKTKMFGQVIGEGEVVTDADAPESALVTGTLTEYKKGNVAEAVLIGFGTGRRSLRMKVDVTRRSDQKSLCSVEVHVAADPRWNEKILAVQAAKQIAKDVKSALEKEPS